ncbi:hypothetical protein EDC96DRAFT_424497, partial [Choanephora cucurbitarum]
VFHSRISLKFFKPVINSKAEKGRVNYEEAFIKNLIKSNSFCFVQSNELLKKQSSEGPFSLINEFSMVGIALTPFIVRMRDTKKIM